MCSYGSFLRSCFLDILTTFRLLIFQALSFSASISFFIVNQARDVLYLQVVRDLAVSGGVRPRSQPFPAISKLLAQAAALHKQGILSPSEDRQVGG